MDRKIVMLGTAFGTMGGISAVVNVYRAAGLFDRWNIEYIATHCDGSPLKKLGQAVRALIRFIWLLASGQVAAVHTHTASGPSFWRKSIFFVLAQIWRKPWILHLHGGHFDQYYEKEAGWIGRWAIRYEFAHSACVVALSDEWRSWIESSLDCRNIHVVFNPVQIPPPFEEERESTTLLFLGQLGQRKGIYTLLPAVARLVTEYPGIYLVAGGDGEVDAVRAMADELGIGDRVETPGWISGKAKQALLERAGIYVLPSYNENLPMSVLEAMAAGLPVISTPVGGIPSAIEHGVEGLLVPPGDVDALTAALRTLLADAGLCQRMGAAARAKAIDMFSAEKVVVRLEAIYDELGLGHCRRHHAGMRK